MDLFTLIKKDHRAVQRMLETLIDTGETAVKTRERLFHKIREDLSVHNAAEERILYDRLTVDRESRLLAHEGKKEHELAGELLDELDFIDKTSEEWIAKAKVLKDLVEHHIEEEEGEIHPTAKKIFSKEEAVRAGQQFENLKRELMTELSSSAA